MTCDECFEAVSASVDGELPGDEREAMHLHLDDCADCQRLRSRLLSLSAEMKVQPFPEPGPAEARAVLEAALASLTTSRWSALRRLLRFPWESAAWRHGLRLASFGGAAGLAGLALIVRWILPPYSGTEATALGSLPDPLWSQAAGALPALAWMPLLVMLAAAWTGGWPALLADLQGEARVQPGQVVAAALGMAVAGPFAALPLLAGLQPGAYVLVCCLWSGVCLLAAFALVAFKTPRPLPRLALDFAALVLPLALLESLARAALTLPQASEYEPAIALLVGGQSLSALCLGLAGLLLSLTLLGAGLAGALPPYRGGNGRAIAVLMLAAGLSGLAYGVREARAHLPSPPRLHLESGQVYLLATGESNPWLLPTLPYPNLKLEKPGTGQDGLRAEVAAAYMAWDEPRMLQATRQWADASPGVAWGLSSFVDSLGQRRGPELTVPGEERQKLVRELLGELRWRVLSDVRVSTDSGSVSGRVVDARGRREGLRLRLLEVKGELRDVEAQLAAESDWAERVAAGGRFDSALPLLRTTLSDAEGEFSFSQVPPGRYVLALLPEQPSALTVNSSLPGVFEVGRGEARLEPIRLSEGGQAEDLSLEAGRWQAQGPVEFALSADGPSASLASGAVISTLVDDHPFDTGSARLKALLEGEPEARGLLKLTLLSKDGRRQAESELEVHPGACELEIAARGREGYLQIALVASQGSLRARAVRLEIRP